MAAFTFTGTPKIRMESFNLSFLDEMNLITATAELLRWKEGSKNSVNITGLDLGPVTAAGHLTDITGGTITGIHTSLTFGGETETVDIYQLELDAVRFYDLVQAGKGKALLEMVTAGDDEIHGTQGNDLLKSGAGRDLVLGSGGQDTLIGGDGKDRLDGGAGRDTLTGGKGEDKFVFTDAPGPFDTITDFSVAQDSFELWRQFFPKIGPRGTLEEARFGLGTEATTDSQRVLYDPATGALRFDTDGLGGAVAVQFAQIGAGLALTAGHFDLVN
jgi:Ca2+-binding RTX toxin-like protein